MKLKSFVASGLLYAAVLGAALVALGIGFSMTSPTGEQSKPSYEGNLWCVSNYIEARDSEGKPVYLSDGRARKDERLDDKTALIRKEQVSAEKKEEAEKKAKENGHGLFEPSDAERLREALDKGDEEFFKTHFNTGATTPGPCIGSGTGNGTIGSWSSQNIAEKCGLINQSTEFEVVKKIRVNLTTYCPCLPSTGNKCDCPVSMGGDESTADGSGMFKVVNGRLSWVKNNGNKVEKYVFAEPQSDHIIPWSQKDVLAIVIPGFNENQPIHVRDHYAKGWHENENYLDLFAPCNEWKTVSSFIKKLSHATGGEGHSFAQVEAYVIDTSKPTMSKKTTTQTSNTLPDGTPCPESVEPKPADGEDYQLQIAKQYEQELSKNDGINSDDGTDTSGNSGSYGQVEELGKTANPGGASADPSFRSCHGKTPCHPAEWYHHNAIFGDAVDIGTDGKAYAAFDGTAVAHNYGKGGRADLTGIKLTSTNGRVVAHYVHVVATKTGRVNAGDVIGKLYKLKSWNHIHFELQVDGQTVHGDKSLRGSQSAYVKSLWNNMKKVLGL